MGYRVIINERTGKVYDFFDKNKAEHFAQYWKAHCDFKMNNSPEEKIIIIDCKAEIVSIAVFNEVMMLRKEAHLLENSLSEVIKSNHEIIRNIDLNFHKRLNNLCEN